DVGVLDRAVVAVGSVAERFEASGDADDFIPRPAVVAPEVFLAEHIQDDVGPGLGRVAGPLPDVALDVDLLIELVDLLAELGDAIDPFGDVLRVGYFLRGKVGHVDDGEAGTEGGRREEREQEKGFHHSTRRYSTVGLRMTPLTMVSGSCTGRRRAVSAWVVSKERCWFWMIQYCCFTA